eukprot:scaffold195286_cov30-Tisochrysis_lutea.AAC.3
MAKAGGSGASAAMVHDRATLGGVAHLYFGPARLHEHAPAGSSRRLDDGAGETFGVGDDHRAEADEDGLIAAFEPRHQRRERRRIERGGRLLKEKCAHDSHVLGPVFWLRHERWGPHGREGYRTSAHQAAAKRPCTNCG